MHKGHLCKFPELVKTSKKFLDDHTIKLAKDMGAINTGTSAIQALVYEQTGILLTKRATEYLQTLGKHTGARSEDGHALSAAEQILAYVKERPDISYFVVHDDPHSEHLTIPQQRGKKTMIRTTVIRHSDGTSTEQTVPITVDDQIAQYVKDKRKDLELDKEVQVRT